jgi:hypothetical protein
VAFFFSRNLETRTEVLFLFDELSVVGDGNEAEIERNILCINCISIEFV